MEQHLHYFIELPLLAFLLSAILPKKREKLISSVAIYTSAIHLLFLLFFTGTWLYNGLPVLNSKYLELFEAGNIHIFIDFYFDSITPVFAIVGSVITLLVSMYSRFYMHREQGFKRYFSTLMLFYLAYNTLIFSGNFETLFIGWEILGVCSFLLIAFYRDRYLPVKNSLKVISIYRFGDVCLILVMWMSHHLWHENILFFKLNDLKLVESHLLEHNWYAIFIAIMLVMAATIKSAQFPFSSWLPRAMEGPSTSSAIFYGSLSVHLGVFVLFRTFPYWESLTFIKVLIVIIGLSTSIIATGIAKVQSSIKTQIAYASVAQIGLIFIEVALDFRILALIHFSGNALLRTYQLLVSPSVLSYLIHDMVFSFVPTTKLNVPSTKRSQLRNAFYVLSIQEWHLDSILHTLLWKPFKFIGNQLNFLNKKFGQILLSLLYIFGLISDFYPHSIHSTVFNSLPYFLSFAGLILIFSAFSQRGNALKAWFSILAAQLFIALSIAILNEKYEHGHMLLYLSGSVISAIVGTWCLLKIQSIDGDIDLNKIHGYVYESPKLSFTFLLCSLSFIGLPFTPTFIGIDLLFSHIHKHEGLLVIFTSLSFVFLELSILRIYARIFLGPHKKNDHPIAFKAS